MNSYRTGKYECYQRKILCLLKILEIDRYCSKIPFYTVLLLYKNIRFNDFLNLPSSSGNDVLKNMLKEGLIMPIFDKDGEIPKRKRWDISIYKLTDIGHRFYAHDLVYHNDEMMKISSEIRPLA